MAKVRSSLINFQGTLDKLTFVNSRAYGPHVRMKRGTHTPIKMSKAFKQSSDVLVKANVYAKRIKDAFEPWGGQVKDGTAWSRLVSLVKKTLAAGKPTDYSFLKGFEFNAKKPRCGIATVDVQTVQDKKNKLLELSFDAAVHFPERLKLDAYTFRTIVVFFHPKKNMPSVFTEEFTGTLPARLVKYKVEIPLPPKFEAAVIGVKVRGYKEGSASFNKQANGLEIVDALVK
jgi:hypothetical protein